MKNIRKRLNYKRQQLLAKFDHFISKILTLERQITRGATGLKKMTFYHFSSPKRFGIMNSENQLIRLGCYWEVLYEYDNGLLVRRIPSRHNLLKGERLATQEEIAQ